MRDLIEALTILMKYQKPGQGNVAPTHCEHDIFVVAGCGIGEHDVSAEDAVRLDTLGFFWNEEYEGWASFRFGSC